MALLPLLVTVMTGRAQGLPVGPIPEPVWSAPVRHHVVDDRGFNDQPLSRAPQTQGVQGQKASPCLVPAAVVAALRGRGSVGRGRQSRYNPSKEETAYGRSQREAGSYRRRGAWCLNTPAQTQKNGYPPEWLRAPAIDRFAIWFVGCYIAVYKTAPTPVNSLPAFVKTGTSINIEALPSDALPARSRADTVP